MLQFKPRPVLNPAEKRQALRKSLNQGKLLRFPGSFSPLISMLIESEGFEGVYISGSVLSNDLGYPDVGLTTLSEVATRGRQIARTTSLPAIIDADTGFGEVLNVARSIQELIELGLAGCHLEDQTNPKKCGHLEGKSLVSQEEMVKKVRAAKRAKESVDDHFLIIARTDARASEGLDAAIERAKSYVAEGADAIFPEALQSPKEFETFRKAISVPLLANMTEFGKSPLLSTAELENLGFNMVIYPVTLFRMALGASRSVLQAIHREGSQQNQVPLMFTRQELYDLTHYSKYEQFDQSVFQNKKN
jgi:methylisocitrate lyase